MKRGHIHGVAAKLAVATLLSTLGIAGPALGQVQPEPRLDIVSPAKVTLSPKTGAKSATATVIVRNSGPAISAVSFEVVGTEKPVPVVTVLGKAALDARAVAPFKLEFTTRPASGALVARAPEVAPGTVQFESSPAKGVRWWIWAVVFGPLALALVVILGRWLTIDGRPGLTRRLGPVDWDFSKSWASNVTVIGALLGTILSAGVLPEVTTTPKATYAGLNLLFAVVIVVAPFLYRATQSVVAVHQTTAETEPQYQGYVWSFLVSSALTLWAVVGELATIGLLFDEIRTGRSMPSAAVWTMGALLAISGVLLLRMAARRLGDVLNDQTDVDALKRRRRATITASGAALPNDLNLVPELPEWSPL